MFAAGMSIFISLLIIAGVIFFIFFIYNLMYKHQINNSLHGKHGFGFMEPINFIFSIILIVILIINISMNGKIKDLNDEIDYLKQELHNKIQSLNNQYNTLLNKYDQLIRQDQWIETYNYEYLDFTEDKTKINVKLSFTIKELKPNAKIYVLVTEKTDINTWQKIEVEHKGFLSFIQEIALDLDKEYIIYLSQESTDNQTQEKLTEINVKGHFSFRVVTNNSNIDKNKIVIDLSVDNYYIPKFKIQKVEVLKLIVNENENQKFEGYETIDITDKVTITDIENLQVITGTYIVTDTNFEILEIRLIDGFGNTIPTKIVYYQGDKN